MKLTERQIEKLYLFTRQHFVEWYDLQTELVDHLANAIETQWQEFPNRTFDEALQIEFKKFGVFGFMEVVENRQAALNKKYNKIVWNHFKEFFCLPQIIATFSAVGILFYILKASFYSELVFSGFYMVVMGIFVFELVKSTRQSKKRNQQTGKKWLFKEILLGYGQSSSFMFFPLQFLFHFDDKFNNDFGLFLISLLSVSLVLVQYVILYIIPSKAEQYLKETYPEYELL